MEDAWSTITEVVNEVMEAEVPLVRGKKRLKQYMTSEVLSLRRKKERLWNKYSLSGQLADQRNFAKVRNLLRSKTRKLRRDFEKELAGSIKSNPKKFWSYINKKMKVRPAVESLRVSSTRIASSDEEKCDALNDFFQSVFTQEVLKDMPHLVPRQVNEVLDDICITEEDVKTRLLNINPWKAPGLDGLHPRMLIGCASALSGPLRALFQKSLDLGTLPSAWKRAVVKPIFKKGDHHELGNYRPVSLTSIVAKIMEKIVKKRIMEHLLQHELLSEFQYGFIPGKSCESQLLSGINMWTNYIEEGHPVDIIYTDFKKAFDAVPHERLLIKLKAYGLGDKVVNWLRGFLCGRKQCVSVNGSMSSWAEVTSGIPQGTVLGPLCFLIYINDLPEVVKTSSILMFADDAKLFCPVSSTQNCDELQRDFDNVLKWSTIWQLPLNLDKCSVMHLGSKNAFHRYSAGDVLINQTVSERDLGVQIDHQLKFHEHTASVLKKCKSIVAVIKRSFICLNRRLITMLYKALIRPVLEYGNSVWGPSYMGDKVALEKLQRRVTKMVTGLSHTHYPDRLKHLNLPSLAYRRTRGDLITIFKLVTGRLKADANLLKIERGPHRTRGHSLRLTKVRAVKHARRNCLLIRGANAWNSLPERVVASKSVPIFKNRLDRFFKDKMFHTD